MGDRDGLGFCPRLLRRLLPHFGGSLSGPLHGQEAPRRQRFFASLKTGIIFGQVYLHCLTPSACPLGVTI